MARLDIALERGTKRVFASALDWPGWCRSAKDDAAAVEALLAYADRFRPVATRAGLSLPRTYDAVVAETLPGGATTDFGAPGTVAAAERTRTDARAARRLVALVTAAWTTLDDVAAHAPEVLRKGPRGGGRDRDDVVRHVVDAERAYAGKIGLKPATEPDLRAAILRVIGQPSDGSDLRANGWPARYAARRVAWHALDHAWEIEDRSDAGAGG